MVVQLSSSNPNVANVPATATIPVGFVESAFNITTSQVAARTLATLSGSSGGVTRSLVLTVTPEATLAPDSVAITRAEYDTGNRRLRVEATSTNANATLQVFVTSSSQLIGTLSTRAVEGSALSSRGRLIRRTSPCEAAAEEAHRSW